MQLEEPEKANVRKTEHIKEASEKSRERLSAHAEVFCDKIFKN